MAERNYYTDITDCASNVFDSLGELNPGSKEKLTEAQIYDMLNKNLIEAERIANQEAIENRKIDLEEKRLAIEADEARWNKIWGGIKVGLTAVQLGVSGWFGWNYLKANMQFGNMVGKDGKGWFDEIKRIKL